MYGPERCARRTCWRTTLNTSLLSISVSKRAHAREFFDELQRICQEELFETGEFTLPGIARLVLHRRETRTGRNPATGETITISARSVVRARIAKQLKDAVIDW